MQLTVVAYANFAGVRKDHCAKLNHPASGACVFGCDKR